ncbi:DNA-directed RNA polymerase subunit P [Candidatus Bathyarchaeota archaeon]|jgi:DNA-directed RNA polymerase subunit P|nr:MAG: DNA-directed RNA polymerase subunit P [Candidatus Bathyarchaeota archaeon]
MSANNGIETTNTEGPVYECVKCARRVAHKDLQRYISFRCPYCGYRIFRKVRAPIVKRVKAR